MKNLNVTTESFYEFADFRLLPSERLLLRSDGQPVPLAPKVFDTLLFLVEHAGRLVEKDELLEEIWADTFIEEGTLARNISILRKALGEADGRKFIETVPKRGYRFVEPVRRLTAEEKTDQFVAGENKLPEIAGEAVKPPQPKTRRLWLLMLLIAGVVGGLLVSLSFWNAKPKNAGNIKTVAVLPFKSIGAAERDESLELGMAEAVITRLGNVRQIIVRPPGSISKYLESRIEATQAGKDLRVEAVLEGTIQRQGDEVRVTARLIRTEDGTQLWGETFDSRLTNIFSVQDSISKQIVESLDLKLSAGEQNSLRRRETASPEAYQLYLKGRYFLSRPSPKGLQKAVDYFTQAIVLDAGFASAYSGLADGYSAKVSNGYAAASEDLSKARAAADKALQLDESLADAHASLGHILWLSWDWGGAEREIKRALELNPNSTAAHVRYSVYLSSLARHDEAIAAARRAVELDPTSIPTNQILERAYYFARRYDETIAASDKTLELNPRFSYPNSWREMAFAQKGMRDASVETRLKAMSEVNANPDEIENLRKIYRAKGWQGFWQTEAEKIRARATQNYVFPYNIARYYARAGNREEALAWLERCFQEHSDHLTLLKVDPIFDELRDDQRYKNLLERVGLN